MPSSASGVRRSLLAAPYVIDTTLTASGGTTYPAPTEQQPTSIVNGSGTTEVLNAAGTGSISRTLAAANTAACNVSGALVVVGLTAKSSPSVDISLNGQPVVNAYPTSGSGTYYVRVAVGDISDLVSAVAAPLSKFCVHCTDGWCGSVVYVQPASIARIQLYLGPLAALTHQYCFKCARRSGTSQATTSSRSLRPLLIAVARVWSTTGHN